MANLEFEKEKIKEKLQYFFDGYDKFDAETIKKAFFPGAELAAISPRGLIRTSLEKWCEGFEPIINNPEHPAHKEKSRKNILNIDITGTAASAKVEWIFQKVKFTDYYNMMKIDGEWFIMSKIWHTEDI